MTVDGAGHPQISVVTATAPVRICDVGGWTDTWFGAPGVVCSLAVGPAVSVTAELSPRPDGATRPGGTPPIHLVAPDVGVDHRFGPDPDRGWDQPSPSVEPLLQHAVAEVMSTAILDPDQVVTVTISSLVPPGASLGTSASVVVAVVAALRELVEGPGAHLVRSEIAQTAHRVETHRAGREAGVQDHWSAALGGALHLAIDGYPDVRVLPLPVTDELRDDLASRVVTVAIGSHDSSAVHGEVVRAFLTCDGVEHDRVRQAARSLASLAAEAAGALEASDVESWAEVLVRSTDVQRAMHPGLVGAQHERAIEVARDLGALGWKVNGAGGAGGSLSVVVRPGGGDRLRHALTAADPRWRVLDLSPGAPGVTVSPG